MNWIKVIESLRKQSTDYLRSAAYFEQKSGSHELAVRERLIAEILASIGAALNNGLKP